MLLWYAMDDIRTVGCRLARDYTLAAHYVLSIEVRLAQAMITKIQGANRIELSTTMLDQPDVSTNDSRHFQTVMFVDAQGRLHCPLALTLTVIQVLLYRMLLQRNAQG